MGAESSSSLSSPQPSLLQHKDNLTLIMDSREENLDPEVELIPSPVEEEPKRSSRRCPVDGCQSKLASIIGECRYCSSKFCSTHRLPESHLCPGLSACKTSSRLMLSERLLNEKCVAEKL